MRLAVTGRTGQLVRALREIAGPELTVIPVSRPELDLSRPETVLPALKVAIPDAIVNAAAYTAVDLAESEPGLAAQINGSGAGAVARAAERLRVPLIQLSTDYVFDGAKESPYTEEDPPLPRSVYGGTKLLGEMALAEAGDNYVILRTSWLYAPYGKNFVRTMLALAGEKKEIRVVDDQVGSPTYAPELAGAVLRIARALAASPRDRNLRGIFHFAGKGETDPDMLAEATAELVYKGTPEDPVLAAIKAAAKSNSDRYGLRLHG